MYTQAMDTMGKEPADAKKPLRSASGIGQAAGCSSQWTSTSSIRPVRLTCTW